MDWCVNFLQKMHFQRAMEDNIGQYYDFFYFNSASAGGYFDYLPLNCRSMKRLPQSNTL